MQRRQFIGGAVIAASGIGLMAQTSANRMEDMHAPRYKGVEDAASRCAASGEDCLRHSLGMWAMKDLTMSACADSVMQLIAACRALATLAALNSQFTVAFAKDVALVCDVAEKECRKFAGVSPECRDCADSCRKCSDECRKLAAAR